MIKKHCPKCKNIQPISEFWKNKCTSDGYQTYCKSCLRPSNKKWVEENKERHQELQRSWYKKNREQHLLNSKVWAHNNRDKKRQHRAKRLITERNAAGSFSAEELNRRMNYYNNKCIYCLDGEYENLEHAIPLDVGGTNWPANLFPSCESCNKRKDTMTIWQYVERFENELYDTIAYSLYRMRKKVHED